jgi:hypothetical protein
VGRYGGGLAELWLLLSKLLAGSKLLLLGSKLLLLGSKSLWWGSSGESRSFEMGEVGGERIDLTILIFVTGESVETDVFLSELGSGDEGSGGGGSRLGSELVSRLLEELLLTWLLRGKLLLGLLSKLLWLLSKLLLSLSKLLSTLVHKLLGLEVLEVGIELLLLGLSKLLLLLGSKLLLLWLLLLLSKLLVESLGVELLVNGLVGVEVGGIEDRPPPGVGLVGKLPPPDRGSPSGGFFLLASYNIGLELEDGLVTFPLQLKGSGLGGGSGPAGSSVIGKPGGVVGRVLNDLQIPKFIQVSVLTFNVAFLILCFEFEGTVGGFVSDSVCSVFVDLIDLLEDDNRGGGGWLLDGGGGGSFGDISAGVGDGEGFQFQLSSGGFYGGDTLLLGSCGHHADEENQTRKT